MGYPLTNVIRNLCIGAVLAVSFLYLCFPVQSFASHTSVVSDPANDTVLLQIADPTIPQEFFGQLKGFPHTYTFNITKVTKLEVALSIPQLKQQKKDAVMILVKAAHRGVTEVGRTLAKDQTFLPTYDPQLAASFLSAGSMTNTLDPGAYTLEVSSPDNDAIYRLVLGNEPIHRGYFASLQRLFEVRSLIGAPFFGALLSPLLYIPILLLSAIGAFLYVRKKGYLRK